MHHPVRQYSRVDHSPSDLERRQIDTPSPSLGKDSSINMDQRKKKYITVIIMILPLVSQAAISIAIALIMLFALDQSQYFLARHPNVTLADGTVAELEGYHILQSDITTLLSVSLVLLRWIAAAWAGPLCWRAICLLGESHGLRRRDIRWASSRGVFPPGTHFQHPLALILGVILIISALPQALSPVLTGSVRWEPSTLHSIRIPEPSQPIVNLTGVWPGERSVHINSVPYLNFPTAVISNYIAAWGTSNETHISKRVVPSISRLGVDSTLANVSLPYLNISIEWIQDMPSEMEEGMNAIWRINNTLYQPNVEQALQQGYIWVTPVQNTFNSHSWYLALSDHDQVYDNSCLLRYLSRVEPLGNCFVMARVSYTATAGYCINCRVTSPSVVQNDTDLLLFEGKVDLVNNNAAQALPNYMTNLLPLIRSSESLPSPQADPASYVEMYLSRVYSAVWNAYSDVFTDGDSPPKSYYNPSVPVLRARVDLVRVLVWLGVQIAATCAGLVFLYLQSRSKHPLIGDTAMVAFDMDSSDAPKPGVHDKSEPATLFRILPLGEGWKVFLKA